MKKKEESKYLRRSEQELYEEKQKTEKLLGMLKQELKNVKSSSGTVIVKTRGDSFQFYLREADEAMKYLSVREKERVTEIVKAEYYNRLKTKLEKRIKVINRCIVGLEETDPTMVYEMMGKGNTKVDRAVFFNG